MFKTVSCGIGKKNYLTPCFRVSLTEGSGENDEKKVSPRICFGMIWVEDKGS